MHHNFLKFLGVALIACVSAKLSATTASNHSSMLVKRRTLLDDSCLLPDYYERANSALQDARKIVHWAASNENIEQSTAFKHYFLPEDVGTVKDMFWLLTGVFFRDFNWRLKCGTARNPHICTDGRSVAVAQIQLGGSIALCDNFFADDIPDVRQTLGDKRYTRHRRNGWCQQGQEFPFFQVGGVIILHELTHLDYIGRQAGLPARRGSHGTDDIYDAGTRRHTQMFRYMSPWQCEFFQCSCSYM
ncbi:MAG: hypothetical protein M1831_001402 [Alyxoria varia]|nr:MAG: hypothetical protein M1831_001402 [Alyxoria varia]